MRQLRLGFGRWAAAVGILSAVSTAGCGGNVVVDHDSGGGGAGGEGGSPTTSSTASSTITSSTTGTTTSTTSSTTTTTTTTTSTTTTTTTNTVTGGETLVEVPLGTFPVGASFAFDIPPNTLGFTLVGKAPGGTDLAIGLDKLWAPDGTQLVNDFSLGPQNDLFFYAGNGVLGASVPQSDDPQAMPVQAGTWTAEYGDPGFGSSNDVEAYLWVRQTVDGKFHGGVLDVNIFLVPGVANPDQIMIDLEDAYTDWGGIKLGNVTFFDLSPDYDIITEDNFYSALNQTKAAGGKPALNVLYVSLLAGQLEGAAGVSSGLPGVAIEHGTNASGVIAMHFNDLFDTIVLKHEGGHFAGLFHTTEFAPGNGDFLSDTPQCADVEAQFEGCPDFDNIMFPTGGSGALFSPMQIRVLQGSDVYRGVFQPGAAPAAPFFLAPPSGEAPWVASFDMSQRAPSARTRTWTAPATQAWAAGLPFGAADALGGLVCPHGAASLDAAWSDALSTLALVSDATLLSIARDRSAAPQARVRSLQALGSRAPSGATAAAIEDLAASNAEPDVVRVAAIRASQRGTPAARAALEGRLGGAPDLVKRVAARLLR